MNRLKNGVIRDYSAAHRLNRFQMLQLFSPSVGWRGKLKECHYHSIFRSVHGVSNIVKTQWTKRKSHNFICDSCIIRCNWAQCKSPWEAVCASFNFIYNGNAYPRSNSMESVRFCWFLATILFNHKIAIVKMFAMYCDFPQQIPTLNLI